MSEIVGGGFTIPDIFKEVGNSLGLTIDLSVLAVNDLIREDYPREQGTARICIRETVPVNVINLNILSEMSIVEQFSTIVQFKKREKHPWSSFTFNKVAG